MLSIEYRLAPEYPYPAPLEDAYSGLVWLAAHAAELDVDPDRIAVMGDSAGGGLAAAVAILSRDRGGPALAHQILLYPMLDDRTTTPDPEIVPFAGWTYSDNITGWNALLGERIGDTPVDPTAAPLDSSTPPDSPPPTSRSASSTSSPTRTSPTHSPSAMPGYPSNCTCTQASRTSMTPSRSTPTFHDAPSPTVTAC